MSNNYRQMLGRWNVRLLRTIKETIETLAADDEFGPSDFVHFCAYWKKAEQRNYPPEFS
jgi:hypothetical protein